LLFIKICLIFSLKKINMKKIYTLLFLLPLITVKAQVARMQLFESFSGENCPPCAAVNPYVNTLMGNNKNKIVLLKYQAPIPSAGPLYTNTPGKTDVDTRLSYYGVNSAPDGYQDGRIFSGHPGNFTQNHINSRSGVLSPISIDLKHTVSSTEDTVFVTMKIKAHQAISGNLKARIAVIEELMTFTTAPGSNGEKEFHHVMKKMLPNAGGTTVPAMAAGDSMVINLLWPLQNIRDMSEMCVIGFVQNDGVSNREVLQAAKTSKRPLNIDVAVNHINLGLFTKCNNTFDAQVTIKNEGLFPMDSALIMYRINNNLEDTLVFYGNIPFDSIATITIPNLVSNTGLHRLTVRIDKPNNQTDIKQLNNTLTASFYVVGNYINPPIQNDFQPSGFPGQGWFVYNPNGDVTWTKRSGSTSGGFALSTASAKLDFYNSPIGFYDEMYTNPLNFTSITNNTNLHFSVSYAQRDANSNDRLTIEISTDCGQNWDIIYNKAGNDLKTTSPSSAAFTPTIAAHWRRETIDLSSYAGQAEVLLKFKGTSHYGNNLYLDDIELNDYLVSAKNINNEQTISLSAYPNPAKDEIRFNFGKNTQPYIVNLVNMQGQVVKTETFGVNSNEVSFNTNNLATGLYTYQITNANELVKVGKVNIVK
jgi:hypothetical protein